MDDYNFEVDLVITWVDGSDEEWLKEKNKYLKANQRIDIDASVKRYRDWDNVQYIFRGIEKFAPWVRKVFFITCGQKPKWLNKKNEKLVWVNHADFIPVEYLPTFSSRPIEFNLHKIDELSEHFILMNDDFFFTKPVKKSDFFGKNGLPKLIPMEFACGCGVGDNEAFNKVIYNNTIAISSKFNKFEVKNKKWYSLKNPVVYWVNKFYDRTAKQNWVGFYFDHLPSPVLKSAIKECWEMFYDECNITCKNKFRSSEGINQYIFTDYMLCRNKFEIKRFGKLGKAFNLDDSGENKNIDRVCGRIKKQKYKTICLNDANVTNFEDTKKKINSSLNCILPQKSSFEK